MGSNLKKLSSDDMREILSMRIYGWSAGKTARYFGVGKSTIIDIWGGKTWRDITRNPRIDALKAEIRELKNELYELKSFAKRNSVW